MLILLPVLSMTRPRAAARRLCWRSWPPEVEAEFRLALAFGRDLAVHLLCVVAAFGDGLRAGFEACLDLQDLGRSILGRVDPVPFRRKPVAGKVCAPVSGIARQVDGTRQNGRVLAVTEN